MFTNYRIKSKSYLHIAKVHHQLMEGLFKCKALSLASTVD